MHKSTKLSRLEEYAIVFLLFLDVFFFHDQLTHFCLAVYEYVYVS